MPPTGFNRNRRPGQGGRSIGLLLLVGVLAAAQVPSSPTGGGTAPVLQAAWAKVDVAAWEDAIRLFGTVAATPGTTADDQAAALYGEAYCWQYRNLGDDQALARRLYQRVLDECPASPAVPFVLMEQARLADLPKQEADRDPAAAAALYRRILTGYPDHPLADEACIWLAVQSLEQDALASRDQGMRLLLEHLDRRPDNSLAVAMLNLLAKEHVRRGVNEDSDDDFRQALVYFERCERIGLPTLRLRSQSCFQAARIAEWRLRDYATAIRWYQIIVDEMPRDRWSPNARQAIERCRRLSAGAPEAADG
jgi:tetratricopeptide (TPR) repeat protein